MREPGLRARPPSFCQELSSVESRGTLERKVLLLFSDTGGGHRSVAEALAEAFGRQAPSTRVILLDLLHARTHFPLNQAGQIYQFMVQRAPVLWRALWRLGEDAGRLALMMRLCTPLIGPVRTCLREQSPDLVISVHGLLNHVPLRILREVGNPAPFVTVVTDWVTVHQAWLCAEVDLCVVPSEPAARRAEAIGIPPHRLRVVGMPVSSRFRPLEQDAKRPLRGRLGLDPDRPAVLLAGGGGGIGSLERIATSIAHAMAELGLGQLIIICGRNEPLRRRLAGRRWPLPVVVQGFVTDMPDWMGCADLIITKAGPSTIAEALAAGVPMILYGFITGQEEGNVPYVVDHGAGVYVTDPADIARTVTEWLRPGNPHLAAMAERARGLGRPAAADDVVAEVLQLLPIR